LALEEVAEQIRGIGVSLVSISPQRTEFLRQAAKKNSLSFPLLSDQGNQVAGAFGLVARFPDELKQLYLKVGVDLARHNGDDSWELPIPAQYAIGSDGVIREVKADPDYTVRPEPTDTLARLEQVFRK